MDGEGGYRPSAAETEVTNPVKKLEQNFVEGFAALLSRNPNYPCTPQDYIKRANMGIVQAYGAVAPKDGKDSLSGQDRDDPQNYVFMFGAGTLRQDDLANIGVPFQQKGKEALIAHWVAQKTFGAKPGESPNITDFVWGMDQGIALRVRIQGNQFNPNEPVEVLNCVAEVPLVHPPVQDGQPVIPMLTGEDLINSAVQKSKAAKT
jgi:hypothetical protein